MMNALIVKSALHYVEFSSVFAILIVLACALLAYRISIRRPLYYNLFVVEMLTWTNRRMVQVLHLGQEFHPTTTWDRLVQRMRARAPRIQGEQRIATSDTNIVIQSPNTVIDSPAPARAPDVDRITLWDIEMPPPHPDHVPDATRDSQYAAAAAIAILARGDDHVLRSRVFRNSENRSTDDETQEEGRPRVGAVLQPALPSGFVTTDVTYTTPSLNESAAPSNGNERLVEFDARETDEEYPYELSDDLSSSDDDHDIEELVLDGLHWSEEEVETEGERRRRLTREQPLERVDEERSTEDSNMIMIGEIKADEPAVLIRLKFLNDTEKDAFSKLGDSIAKFKMDHFPDVQGNQVIRLIFQGQLLREDHKTLKDYGVVAGSVIHCHISTTPFDGPRPFQPPPPILHRTTRPRRIPRLRPNMRAIPPLPGADDDSVVNELERRRVAAQDGNVGQVYLILSAIAPILSAIGGRLFQGNRARDMFRPAALLTLSHWICNLLVEHGILERQQRNAPNAAHMQASTLFWIFSGQVLAVSIFFYYFPDIFDRVGFSILGIVFLYFVFVIFSRQRRRQPRRQFGPAAPRNNHVADPVSLM